MSIFPKHPDTISPGNQVTVIIRDDSPMIFCGDSPSYRTVVFNLTPEQEAAIGMKRTGMNCGTPIYEAVSQIILQQSPAQPVRGAR